MKGKILKRLIAVLLASVLTVSHAGTIMADEIGAYDVAVEEVSDGTNELVGAIQGPLSALRFGETMAGRVFVSSEDKFIFWEEGNIVHSEFPDISSDMYEENRYSYGEGFDHASLTGNYLSLDGWCYVLEDGKVTKIYKTDSQDDVYNAYPLGGVRILSGAIDYAYTDKISGEAYSFAVSDQALHMIHDENADDMMPLYGDIYFITDNAFIAMNREYSVYLKLVFSVDIVTEVIAEDFSGPLVDACLSDVDITPMMEGFAYLAEDGATLFSADGEIYSGGTSYSTEAVPQGGGLYKSAEGLCFEAEEEKIVRIYFESDPERIFHACPVVSDAEVNAMLGDLYVGEYEGQEYKCVNAGTDDYHCGTILSLDDINRWDTVYFRVGDGFARVHKNWDHYGVRYVADGDKIVEIYKQGLGGREWDLLAIRDRDGNVIDLEDMMSGRGYLSQDKHVMYMPEGGCDFERGTGGVLGGFVYEPMYYAYDAETGEYTENHLHFVIEEGKVSRIYWDSFDESFTWYPVIDKEQLLDRLENLYRGETRYGEAVWLEKTKEGIARSDYSNYSLDDGILFDAGECIVHVRKALTYGFMEYDVVHYVVSDGKVAEIYKDYQGIKSWDIYPDTKTPDLAELMDGYVYMSDDEEFLYIEDGEIRVTKFGATESSAYHLADFTYDAETGVCASDAYAFTIVDGKVTQAARKGDVGTVFLAYPVVPEKDLLEALGDQYTGEKDGVSYILGHAESDINVTHGGEKETYSLGEFRVIKTGDGFIQVKYDEEYYLRYTSAEDGIEKVAKRTGGGAAWEVMVQRDREGFIIDLEKMMDGYIYMLRYDGVVSEAMIYFDQGVYYERRVSSHGSGVMNAVYYVYDSENGVFYSTYSGNNNWYFHIENGKVVKITHQAPREPEVYYPYPEITTEELLGRLEKKYMLYEGGRPDGALSITEEGIKAYGWGLNRYAVSHLVDTGSTIFQVDNDSMFFNRYECSDGIISRIYSKHQSNILWDAYAVYDVITDEVMNGTVTADASPVRAGDEVTLTVTPNEGCLLKKLYCNNIEIEPAEGIYRFTMPAKDANITAEWESTAPAFMTHSLILGSQIGVNFFMNLPEIDGVDYSDSYVEFTVSGKGGKTLKEPFDRTFMNANGTYYGFTCHVNSIQMADAITAVFHYTENGEEKTVEHSYTVEKYLVAARGMFGDKLDKLLEAMYDYGYYASAYLSELRGWIAGEDHAAMTLSAPTEYTEADLESVRNGLADIGFSKSLTSDISKTSFSLVLDSETAMRLYVTPASGYTGDLTFTVNGSAVEAQKMKDGRMSLMISNIAPGKLATEYDIAVKGDHGTSSINIQPLAYAKACLNLPAEEKRDNSMAALYNYYKAARDYAE